MDDKYLPGVIINSNLLISRFRCNFLIWPVISIDRLNNHALPEGEAHFKKFLHKEFATENYEFWNAIKQLKKKNPQGDKLKRDVRQIYEGYISDNAKTPVLYLKI